MPPPPPLTPPLPPPPCPPQPPSPPSPPPPAPSIAATAATAARTQFVSGFNDCAATTNAHSGQSFNYNKGTTLCTVFKETFGALQGYLTYGTNMMTGYPSCSGGGGSCTGLGLDNYYFSRGTTLRVVSSSGFHDCAGITKQSGGQTYNYGKDSSTCTVLKESWESLAAYLVQASNQMAGKPNC